MNAFLVEMILESSISKSTFSELFYLLQRLIPSLSQRKLKKYLFYMAEYGLISYQGPDQIFAVTDSGSNIMKIIRKDKEISVLAWNEYLGTCLVL